MTGFALAAQRSNPSAFADGLSAWMRGEDSPDAEAAARLAGEVLLRARAWLEAQEGTK